MNTNDIVVCIANLAAFVEHNPGIHEILERQDLLAVAVV